MGTTPVCSILRCLAAPPLCLVHFSKSIILRGAVGCSGIVSFLAWRAASRVEVRESGFAPSLKSYAWKLAPTFDFLKFSTIGITPLADVVYVF